MHQTTGTIHGYDRAEESPIVQQSKSRRIGALQQAFYGGRMLWGKTGRTAGVAGRNWDDVE